MSKSISIDAKNPISFGKNNEFYKCEKCENEKIIFEYKFCPECGIKVEWKNSPRDIEYIYCDDDYIDDPMTRLMY